MFDTESSQLDAIGRAAYKTAGMSVIKPSAGAALELATLLLGDTAVRFATRALLGGGSLLDGSLIYLAFELKADDANWHCGCELARYLLRRADYYRSYRRFSVDFQATLLERLGCWLCAPPEGFQIAVRAFGTDVEALADWYGLSQTRITLLLGETGVRAGAAVVAGASIFQRGARRILCEDGAPISIAEVVLISDEPDRVGYLSMG